MALLLQSQNTYTANKQWHESKPQTIPPHTIQFNSIQFKQRIIYSITHSLTNTTTKYLDGGPFIERVIILITRRLQYSNRSTIHPTIDNTETPISTRPC